ncbi:MAG: hypothetical protein UR46_C0024G0002 [Parcubacteria group bacterium GW2011_GWA1_33_6]|nr:MAG: hypothetical protein UR46_C0024G0002 [Parcubacteria group bacterium GW2011_GWA1_33_6]
MAFLLCKKSFTESVDSKIALAILTIGTLKTNDERSTTVTHHTLQEVWPLLILALLQ